jgi:hypothetical protein
MGRSAGKCRPFPFVEPDARVAGRITFRALPVAFRKPVGSR